MESRTDNGMDSMNVTERDASIAVIGAPTRPTAYIDSRFFHGVGYADEGPVFWEGKQMFPLLQIRVNELPFVPEQLKHVAVLVLYMNLQRYPFGLPHGQGWLIREYPSVEGLSEIQNVLSPDLSYPIQWRKVQECACLEQCSSSACLCSSIPTDSGTKVGGYPSEILRTSRPDEFVFQIASEALINWKWAQNGVGLFFCSSEGEWRWSCEF